MGRIVDDAEITRHGGDPRGGGRLLGFDLVAHRRDGVGVGSDEDDSGLFQRPGEGLALGEEAVAGMNGLGPRLPAGRDDLLDHQIGFGGGRRPDQDSLVGHLHMQGIPVRVRIDGDRLDAHALGGLDDPAGDLATVGNQNLVEHRPSDATSRRRLCLSVTSDTRVREAQPPRAEQESVSRPH